LIPDHDYQSLQSMAAGETVPDNLLSSQFRRSRLTYFTLFFLLIFWPASSLLMAFDPAAALRTMAVSPIWFVYIPTIVIQWLIFGLVALTVWREKTGLAGLGFRRIRLVDLGWAVAFLLGSNAILTGLSLLLKLVNLEIPGELELILPKSSTERILWVAVSITAGVCEETAFRGYLITRIRLFGKTGSWLWPVLLATLAFGSGHAYQGLGGFILISVYGLMFALLLLHTRTIWPGIIAHFFQDFSAIFFPFQG